MKKTVSDQALLATLRRLERFAELSDNTFRIPFTQIRFGLDAIIGLIPVIGDVIGFIASCYLLFEASKLSTPWSLRIRMLINMLLDWLIGLVPILGDVGDIAFKANKRNMQLLLRHINDDFEQRQYIQPENEGSKLVRYLLPAVTVLLLLVGIYSLTRYLNS